MHGNGKFWNPVVCSKIQATYALNTDWDYPAFCTWFAAHEKIPNSICEQARLKPACLSMQPDMS